ncbi:histone deacetylase family protein [Tepidamorphus sp. 3E244]|uniref:histone deacetylase family protein n=1 Tax=Tepidamorphus sp. 3E244 TaxID=3385498 RepID=UPI0038FCE151
MSTLYLSHPCGLEHLVPEGHPERPDRLRAIERAMEAEVFQPLLREQAPMGEFDAIAEAHPQEYIRALEQAAPSEGMVRIDADTAMSPGTWEAVMRAVGAATYAVDEVMTGKVDNAFCAMRPPGHHAEEARAMGFCLFNSAAIAALHARDKHGAERVAVIDFDVHHGNGTQDIFWNRPEMFYASTHQMPLFPGTGAANETGCGNICNAPLQPGDDGVAFKDAMEVRILPALKKHKPDLIIISAGFDAHERDPLANINLTEEDFAWVTRKLMDYADEQCEGRVVSVLEGGYDLMGLSLSVAAHVRALMGS